MVERFLPVPPYGIRKDFLGIIDIIALKPPETLGVQSCGQNYAEHDRKILGKYKEGLLWMQCNNELMLIGWRKVKKVRGGKLMVWKPRIKTYSREDFVREWKGY
jgi:hypothetical protein